ncbi:MAG TPA: lactonase family protein [Acidobacteriaceae bacterium]|nr:lactonase family protein [Acidobacteriaceae bacterium]
MAKSISNTISRRSFLGGAAALAVSRGLAFSARPQASEPAPDRVLAYVGTYTGLPGPGANGRGIELFEADLRTGQLSHRMVAAQTRNPSWIAVHPSKKYVYAVNEIADFAGESGSVSAFAVDGSSGALRALNTVSSAGAGPAYISIDAAGDFAFVANYGGGSVAVLPIREDGSLGDAADVRRDEGSVGSARATDAPAGSFAISGHDAPHAHMIASDPDNRFVLATDLGQDRIYTWRFDRPTGKLAAPPGMPFVSLPTGDGPRHFAFHPNGRWFYSIQEEASTVVFFHYDRATGALEARQTLSALPRGFAGTSFASEILVAPNGRTVYAANRLHDTIAVFSVGPDGRLNYVTETSTLGDYPVQCRIDPGGNFFYVCNQRSDNITSFRIDHDTGLLSFTGLYTPVGSPGSITFLV